MTLKSGLDDFSRYRNAYLLAVSVALGSLFYGYDVCVSIRVVYSVSNLSLVSAED